MVLWLVLSPGLGSGLVVMLRRSSVEVQRSAVLANLVCTAIIATALWVTLSVYETGTSRAVMQYEIWSIARSEAGSNPVSVWLEVVISFGWDRINAAALLWIPWLALSALLVVDVPQDRPALFYGLYCAWEACLLACFAAYDGVTFLVFDSAAQWLGCALVAGWGQSNRRAAAGRFWRHQFAGHAAWFAGLAGLGVMAAWSHYYVFPQLPALSWTWHALTEQLPRVLRSSWEITAYFASAAPLLFFLLMFGAVLRSPVAPFHSWWPVFVSESPSPVAVLAGAAWFPLGLYAWLRFVTPAFSDVVAIYADRLAFLGELTAVLAGLLALAQTDMRRFAAYAGLCLQGIAWTCASTGTAAGSWVALVLSQAAGISVAAWLLFIAMLERRYRTRELGTCGGLASRWPRLAVAFVALVVCVSGIPALARGGIDLQVAWTLAAARPWGLVASGVGCLTVSWGAVWMLQRLLFGAVLEPATPMSHTELSVTVPMREDLSWTDCAALAPLVAWCIWNWFQSPPPLTTESQSETTAVERIGSPNSTVTPTPWLLRSNGVVHSEPPETPRQTGPLDS